ncbi:TetR/AcrR family transcriptional regulator [Anaerocolumna xylanovorans]|uniref:Transcriptional regulator, TetR family n=1 Tax=Anaerocolumna xylanovorans DSM 12503 TaxID=1121345 RepID=A0A1M7YM77_9FIRM|nr:TetR-like C-terminal domain-containing protein [Anaerocolumna xylanovorans]SHO53626.1 transcriptional regulator, TetR family [Anaerocolumna xylanovorans DSM 12503]
MAQQYTRKMIRDVFVRMLNDRQLNKITVTDIVTACEINRNTFYYHYPDIYSVLSEIFQTEMQKVIDEYNDTRSWEESLVSAMSFAIKNKKAVYHVYNSIQKEELEKYLFEISGNVMTHYVDTVCQNINASPDDKHIIVLFYQYALTEMLINWVASGMKEEQKQIIYRTGLLFNGNIERSLHKSAELSEK